MPFEYDPESTEKMIVVMTRDGEITKNNFGNIEEDIKNTTEYQTRIFRHMLVQMAAILPLASIGTCGQCPGDLRLIGRDDGLYAVCTLDINHCWRLGDKI